MKESASWSNAETCLTISCLEWLSRGQSEDPVQDAWSTRKLLIAEGQ